MIIVSITNIFALYIFIILLAIIAISFYGRKKAKVIIKDRALFNCPVCAYRYIISATERMHRCPQCGSLNET